MFYKILKATMFYLIDEKDGWNKEFILVNAVNLTSIVVQTGTGNFNLTFTHKSEENSFSYKPQEILNVDNIIRNIVNLTECSYNNNFLALTDIGNIEIITKRFGKNSELLSKISTFLININDIQLIYKDNKKYIVATEKENFPIKESPKEVFDMIQRKIVVNLSTNSVENKLELRSRL